MTGLEIRCSMVSVVVLRGAGDATRVLLLQRAGKYLHGVWSYVAGHIEAGETAAQAARRELAEETGLARTRSTRRASASSSTTPATTAS